MRTVLRGISWDHPRGIDPLRAVAQRHMQAHPEVEIAWQARTLKDFENFPLDALALHYDLLSIDHPWMGHAARHGYLAPLERLLPEEFLEDQRRSSVGPSYESYVYEGHLWALPVDAAAQVSAYRDDLLPEVPRSWEEVLRLAEDCARRPGPKVLIPLVAVDAFCAFATLCANLGEEAFSDTTAVAVGAVASEALRLLRRLAETSHPASRDHKPPEVLDLMAGTDEVLYAPLLFGYSNYARKGWRRHPVRFADIPSHGRGPVGSVLGGVGLAISAHCSHLEEALSYCVEVARPDTQRGLYCRAGGQPGHLSAWTDERTNQETNGFFRQTLRTMQGAYLRPRYDGFVALQDVLGEIVHRHAFEGGDPNAALEAMNRAYRESLGQNIGR